MKNILFNSNVEKADWLSNDNRWHLTMTDGRKYSCDVLLGCTGYFSFDNPYEPIFPGMYLLPITYNFYHKGRTITSFMLL